jgi:ABC-2 type transport system ATP-binding protein
LLQCTNYLSRKPWKQCSVANTAVAAVKVIEEGDKTQAAIASELAAELYGLQILAKDIVNNDNNTTRFIILSKQKIFVEKAENISIRFNLSKEKVDNLKELIIKKLKGQKIHFNEFWALKNINFELQKGDRLGILGLNGAGKSTLLKVIAGVYKPTTGTVKRYGHIAPMIELGAGFDPNYTGRENVFLYGSVLGFSREFLEEKYDEILEFSELGEFIDVPIKNYSSGMRARLGFSIATVVEPEILILDEVLSVGDAKFRKKCERKMQKMFDHGVTVLFVSHSLAQVKRLCNKAILLEHGQLIAQGDIDDVSEIYERKLEE